MKRRVLIAMLFTTTILLTGCCLSHEFTEATCTELSTCSKCGETQGELLPHTFTEATCTEPKTCSKCGETEGEPLPHTFTEATCTEPKTCSVCGHIEGETLPHKFTEATCTQPSKCEECGHKEGEALEHQWKASELVPLDKCELCGKLSGTLSFDEMEKIVKKTDEKLYQALAEELGLSLSEIEAIAEKKDTNNSEASNNNSNNTTTSQNANSPYVSEQRGYKVGDIITTDKGITLKYQGKDIWIDVATNKTCTARPDPNDSNRIIIDNVSSNPNPNSPYYSDQLGFKIGDKIMKNGYLPLFYQGQDIWMTEDSQIYSGVNINGEVKVGRGIFAKPGEVPISERLGYEPGDSIHFEGGFFVGVESYNTIYLGNDIWYDDNKPDTRFMASDVDGKIHFTRID